jgi:hypothetical protein
MRFFITAPCFGAAAGLVLAATGSAALISPLHPVTLAVTHLVTLGWLTMVMLGAIYQIMPVLVGVPLPAPGLAPWVHAALTAGVPALAFGLATDAAAALVAAMALLGGAFAVVLGQLAWALRKAPAGNTTVASLRLGAAALGAGVALGLLFAGQHAWGWLALDRLGLLATHAYLGLGGWIGGLISGVAYAVLPMFYLTAPFPESRARCVRALLAAALVLAPLAHLLTTAPGWRLVPLLAAGGALGLFAWTVARQLRARRRKVADATLRFWQTGLAASCLALALLVPGLLWPHPRWLLGFGVLLLVGGAGAIDHGMRYKIVAFLVWFHRFSPHAGRLRVPLMKDIVPQRHARAQWLAFLIAVVLLAAAALHPADLLVRLAGLALALAEVYLLAILVQAARFNPPLEPLSGRSRRAAEGAPAA